MVAYVVAAAPAVFSSSSKNDSFCDAIVFALAVTALVSPFSAARSSCALTLFSPRRMSCKFINASSILSRLALTAATPSLYALVPTNAPLPIFSSAFAEVPDIIARPASISDMFRFLLSSAAKPASLSRRLASRSLPYSPISV